MEFEQPRNWTVSVGNAPANPLREAREQLEQAEALRQQRKFDRAESICASLVRRYPDYFGAQHTLGLIYADKGDYRRAAGSLGQAAMLNPRSWQTLTALAGAYVRLDAHELAAHILERARALRPNEPAILVTLGEIYSEEREYELSCEAFRAALAIEPAMAEAATGLARALTALGEYGEAAETLKALLKRGLYSSDVLAALAALPGETLGADAIAELGKAQRGSNEDQADFDITMGFARAATLDKAGQSEAAWPRLVAANRAAAATLKKELAEDLARRQASMKWLRDNQVRAKPAAVGDEKLPISLFILGPSRSGKSSMESLAATLDGVKRGYENPCLEIAIGRTYQDAGLLNTFSLDHMPPQFYPQVPQAYAEELAKRAPTARVFTNTHPGYIHDIARAAAILPNVRIVFIKRNIDDVVLRIFMRQYKRGNPYSYDLRTAREYVEWYYAMIDQLAAKLPGISRIVHYEEMVKDPAAARRIVAELCGLPAPQGAVPSLGDDRDCSAPYRQMMAAM